MLVLDPKRVRARLALMEWTQGDLAKRIGVSPWGLSRVMAGHATMSEPEIAKVARVLRCDVTEIADRWVKESP